MMRFKSNSPSTSLFRVAFISSILVLLLACAAPARLLGQQTTGPVFPSLTETPAAAQEPGETSPTNAVGSPNSAPPAQELSCAYSPATARMLEETSPEQWMEWIQKLSGAEPIIIAGEETIIRTRFSPAMFSGNPDARAFDFVLETVSRWYPGNQLKVQEYVVTDQEGNSDTWKNLIITLPGAGEYEEIVILSAHLDSTSAINPDILAPGAEDNASGAAALLEAARIFRGFKFQRTIQIVWFTGEEQGLLGSKAFVDSLETSRKVIGAVNLDMFGYDSDGDRCFELHVGTLPQSETVGRCFADSITFHDLDLPQYDYLREKATGGSDHSRFWDAGIGAVEVLEDMVDQNLPGGCPASDPNPDYHSEADTASKINPQSGIELVRAALATVAALAVPLE